MATRGHHLHAAIRAALTIAGGPRPLARALDISPSTAYLWRDADPDTLELSPENQQRLADYLAPRAPNHPSLRHLPPPTTITLDETAAAEPPSQYLLNDHPVPPQPTLPPPPVSPPANAYPSIPGTRRDVVLLGRVLAHPVDPARREFLPCPALVLEDARPTPCRLLRLPGAHGGYALQDLSTHLLRAIPNTDCVSHVVLGTLS